LFNCRKFEAAPLWAQRGKVKGKPAGSGKKSACGARPSHIHATRMDPQRIIDIIEMMVLPFGRRRAVSY